MPSPENGRVTYSNTISAGYASVKTIATYSCFDEYYISEGNDMRICTGIGDGLEGEWDGTAPTCECKNIIVVLILAI